MKPAWPLTLSSFICAIAFASRCPTKREVLSSSSIAAAPDSTRAGSASLAARSESKKSSALDANGLIGTVLKVASDTKARVPSLPISK